MVFIWYAWLSHIQIAFNRIHLPLALVTAVQSKFLKEVWAFIANAQLTLYWGLGMAKKCKHAGFSFAYEFTTKQ